MSSVLFDIDGTLVDTNWFHTVAWARVFKDAGLNVRLETETSGNQLATSVSSGAMKIAYGAVQIVAQAHDRGFKYQYLWPSDFYESGKTPVAAMMVPKGSSVTTAKSLVGKAVNPVAIQSLGDLATQGWPKKSNLPPNSVHEVEVAFPNIGAAFQSKQLAASIVIEPYITILKNQGARVMSDLSRAGLVCRPGGAGRGDDFDGFVGEAVGC